jgi:selenocysteine lyase/cysteine desulfurase
VRDAIDRHRKALDLDPYLTMEHHGELDDEVTRAAADYLEVKSEEIALTDSTTMGLGLVYGGLKLDPGAEVLCTEHDHYSTLTALEHRKARDGITVKTVALYDPAAPESATVAKMTEAVMKALTPKTRLVAITWVHSCSGVKTPVRAIADALAKVNQGRSAGDRVLLSVDGVHGFACEETSCPKLGCDIFITGTHKWLFGPRGTGLVWMKSDVWPLMQPTIPTFSGKAYPMWMGVIPREPLEPALLNSPGGFHSFEHRWALADAFRWHAALGKARVAGRVHALNRQLKEGLSKLKAVKLHTPLADELSAGIVTFDVQGLEPREVVKHLDEQKISASVTPYRPPRFARVSFGILNSQKDVDAVLGAVRKLQA